MARRQRSKDDVGEYRRDAERPLRSHVVQAPSKKRVNLIRKFHSPSREPRSKADLMQGLHEAVRNTPGCRG